MPPRSWPMALGHLAAFAGFAWLTGLILEGGSDASPRPEIRFIAWATMGLATAASWIATALPILFWIPLAWRGRGALALGLIVGIASWWAGQYTQELWLPFHRSTFWFAILAALQIFPPNNPWNQDVSEWPLHPNSCDITASIGPDQPLCYNPDMNFVLIPPDQKRVPVKITEYPGESDRGPFPIPDNMPIEGWPSHERDNPDVRWLTLEDFQRDRLNIGGERHGIVVDPVRGMLYEFFGARKVGSHWQVAQASVFDLESNRLRPETWTSADAAGLPIFPAVVRYDELSRGAVRHALRVTISKTRRAHVYPARHYASRNDDPNLPRMGKRIRLRRDYDTSGFSPVVRTILEGLKRYGMFVADNGINWAISVTPDLRIPILHEELRRVKGAAFESRPDAEAVGLEGGRGGSYPAPGQ